MKAIAFNFIDKTVKLTSNNIVVTNAIPTQHASSNKIS